MIFYSFLYVYQAGYIYLSLSQSPLRLETAMVGIGHRPTQILQRNNAKNQQNNYIERIPRPCASLFICLFVCLFASLRPCLVACMRACLLVCLFACLIVFLSVFAASCVFLCVCLCSVEGLPIKGLSRFHFQNPPSISHKKMGKGGN